MTPLRFALLSLVAAALLNSLGGCPPPPNPDNGGSTPPVYNNTTDPTNQGAQYIGSGACKACHPTQASLHATHGHTQILKKIQDGVPVYPSVAARAGVPNPPEGYRWSDIAYVIGGYIRSADFVDQGGYLLTTGVQGIATQWDLDYPPNGTVADWAIYEPSATHPLPYDYTCFRCHTTGAVAFNASAPLYQDNRPGLAGTWREEGVQCEACHGPGSKHVPDTAARAIYANSSGKTCGVCHGGSDPQVIPVSGGYIEHGQQYPELLASGGHATFACGTCHDPHASAIYNTTQGIRNECTACHPTQNLAFHDGKVYKRGDYQETLTCVSCHMPWASRGATTAGAAVVGDVGKMGDIRTHIFRINANSSSSADFLNSDQTAVAKDSQGRAAVTLDFVCLRCHNGQGNAFTITPDGAPTIAKNMHKNASGQ